MGLEYCETSDLSGAFCISDETGVSNVAIGKYTVVCSGLSADSLQCVSDGKTWDSGTGVCSSADSTGYACITFTKRADWGGTYTAHRIYRMNYTKKTDELIEEAGGSCQDRGFCKRAGNSSSYLSDGSGSCFENDSGDMGEQFGGGSSSSSSSSSSSFDLFSSSSVECTLTGKFSNYCYYECSNGAVGACTGNDGNCDFVSDCTWEDWKSSGSSGGSSGSSGGSSGSSGGSSGSSEVPDYTGKLNEIIDTLHNGNNETRGTNAWLSRISGQIDNLNVNVTVPKTEQKDYSGKLDSVLDAQRGTNAYLASVDSVLKSGEMLDLDSLRQWSQSFSDSLKADSGVVSVDSASSWLMPDTAGLATSLKTNLGIGTLGDVSEGCLSFNFDFAGGKIVDGYNTSYDKDSLKLNLCRLPLGSSGFDFLALFRKIMALGLAVFVVSAWVWTFKDSFGGLG